MPPASTEVMAAVTASHRPSCDSSAGPMKFHAAKGAMGPLHGSCKDAVSLVNERRIEFVPSKHHKNHVNGNAYGVLSVKGQPHSKTGAQAVKSRVLVEKLAVDRVARWQKPRKVGPGFANLGNTCYLNSVLQCLSYTPCLAQFLLQNPVKDLGKAASQGRFCGLRAMNKLLQSVHTPNCAGITGKGHGHHGFGSHQVSGSVIQPRVFVMNVRHLSKRFRIGRQEDAHEFFRLLMESMQHSCLRQAGISDNVSKQSAVEKKLAQTTLMNRIFGGQLQNHLQCVKCGFVSERNDDFMDLSLEIPQGINSIRQALDHFTCIEQLDASNAWRCSSCNQLSCAEKGLSIVAMPQVLVLQLKRFDGMFGKIKKHVAFDVTLDLKRNLRKQSASAKANAAQHANSKYELFAVLVHAGYSTDCGHYYAFVKAPSGQWYEMNDETVRWVNLDTVLQQRAYMLFYSRIIPVVKEQDPPKERVKDQQLSAKAVTPLVAEKPSKPEPAQLNGVKKPVEEAVRVASEKRESMKGFGLSIANAATKKPVLTCVVKYSFHPMGKSTKSHQRVVPRFHGLMGKLLRYSSKASWQSCAPMEMQQHVSAVRDDGSSLGHQQHAKPIQTPKATLPFHPKMVRDHGSQAALFGKEVNGWHDDKERETETNELQAKHQQILGKLKQEDFERRRACRPDEWDEALDMGKTKKLKKRKPFVLNEGKTNVFQLVHQQKKLKV